MPFTKAENNTVQAPLATVPTMNSSTPSIVELFMLNMLQQQQQHQSQFMHLIPSAPSSLPLAPPVLPTASAPSSPAKQHHRAVTLEEFCQHYSITSSDHSRLEKLEFYPRDPIHKLGWEDWHGKAGFSKLAWGRILEKHREFLDDIRRGIWS